MTRFKPVIALALAVLLAACSRGMSLSAEFATPAALEAGSGVYLGDEKVGEVSRFTIAGDVAEAELSVEPEPTAALRKGSAALLVTRDGRTVIELYNYRPGDEPLEDGDELVGLNNSLEFAAWQAGEALETGRKSMDEMSRSISDYFESEEWRQQKERMNRQMEELQDELGRTYAETNEAYRAFMEDLERKSGSARERAKESYAELARRLREEIARLKEEGNENIVEPLQRLLEDLSRIIRETPEQESA